MAIECDSPDEPFRPEEQIQPCSVDLRLGDVFWEPVHGKAIDLRKSRLLELAPRRYWRKKVIKPGECITLKPGCVLLGRVYEVFRVPHDCAGKIEGRSSFARLGLSVHCTGDFLNPGYRGHMPLQLCNYGRNAIRIFPYIPICQLMLVCLHGKPSRIYGEAELQSKYVDDDGGPSYWWRDKRIKRLQDAFCSVDVGLAIQERILQQIGPLDPDTIERFETLVSKLHSSDLENADELIDRFIESEKKLMKRDTLKRVSIPLLTTIPVAVSIRLAFFNQHPWWHVAFWLTAFLGIVASIYVQTVPKNQYFTLRSGDSDPQA